MKCAHCGRKAIYHLKYSGHWLCEKHFIELFERRVKKTIRQNRLLEKGDTVLLGLSGGRDSMSALRILHDIIAPVPHMSLKAVTIDEGKRGKRIGKTRKYCESLGVGHEVISFKESFGMTLDDVFGALSDEGLEACEVCGVLKTRMLNESG